MSKKFKKDYEFVTVKRLIEFLSQFDENDIVYTTDSRYDRYAGPVTYLNEVEQYVGTLFNYVDTNELSWKYMPPITKQREKGGSKSDKRNKHLKRFNRLVPDQYRFHIDTAFLERNLNKIRPDTIISISSKWHGTSGSTGLVETFIPNEDLSLVDRIAKWFGANIKDRIYDLIYASRGVIKNQYINKEVTGGFYKTDVWGVAKEVLKPYISKGMTLYYEIVGYIPNGDKMIQKNHDYGCKPGEFKIRIYRITYTNPDGVVFEFTPIQVQDWCKAMGLDSDRVDENTRCAGIQAVKELYRGKAKDLYPDLDTDNHWHINFLNRLQNDKSFNMEMKDPDCVNNVPFEGLVFRVEGLALEVFKLKTDAHYQMETKELDKGEADIETIEANGEETE